jgi:NAD+ synthase
VLFTHDHFILFAGVHGPLVAGTGNKVEDFGVGFLQNLDGGADLSPIADLMKSSIC